MAEQTFDITLFLLFLHKVRAEKNEGYPSNFPLLLEVWVLFKTQCLTGFFSFAAQLHKQVPWVSLCQWQITQGTLK